VLAEINNQNIENDDRGQYKASARDCYKTNATKSLSINVSGLSTSSFSSSLDTTSSCLIVLQLLHHSPAALEGRSGGGCRTQHTLCTHDYRPRGSLPDCLDRSTMLVLVISGSLSTNWQNQRFHHNQQDHLSFLRPTANI
jgi:hypothetical protein